MTEEKAGLTENEVNQFKQKATQDLMHYIQESQLEERSLIDEKGTQNLMEFIKQAEEQHKEMHQGQEKPILLSPKGRPEEYVEALLTLKTDEFDIVNTPDKNGVTPLVYAVSFGSKETVRLLLENGANIEASSMDPNEPGKNIKTTALGAATANGDQVIEGMIKAHQNKDLATRIQAGLYQGFETVRSAIGFGGPPNPIKKSKKEGRPK